MKNLGVASALKLPSEWRLYRSWVGCLIALIVVNSMAYVFWTHPRWTGLAARSGAEAETREAIRLLEPAIQRSRETYGRIVAAEADLQALRRRLAADSGGVARVVSEVQAAVESVGIGFNRVSYQQRAVEQLGLVELQMVLPFSGSYRAVRRLVEALGSSRAFVTIDQVALVVPELVGAAGGLQIELSVSAFLPDPATAAGGQARTTGGGSVGVAPAGLGSPLAITRELQARLASLPPMPYSPDAYEVRIGELDAPAVTPEQPSRNLFAFAPARGGPSEPGVVTEPPPAPTPQPAPQAGPQTPQVSPQGLPFRLLGIVELGVRRFASLSDGVDLHLATAGTVLPGGFEVVAVGADYAEIVRGELRTRLTLES